MQLPAFSRQWRSTLPRSYPATSRGQSLWFSRGSALAQEHFEPPGRDEWWSVTWDTTCPWLSELTTSRAPSLRSKHCQRKERSDVCEEGWDLFILIPSLFYSSLHYYPFLRLPNIYILRCTMHYLLHNSCASLDIIALHRFVYYNCSHVNLFELLPINSVKIVYNLYETCIKLSVIIFF